MGYYADKGDLDRSWMFFTQLQEGNYPEEDVSRAMKGFGKRSGQNHTSETEKPLN